MRATMLSVFLSLATTTLALAAKPVAPASGAAIPIKQTSGKGFLTLAKTRSRSASLGPKADAPNIAAYERSGWERSVAEAAFAALRDTGLETRAVDRTMKAGRSAWAAAMSRAEQAGRVVGEPLVGEVGQKLANLRVEHNLRVAAIKRDESVRVESAALTNVLRHYPTQARELSAPIAYKGAPIAFYRVHDKYGMFSNFSDHSFKALDVKWPTSEHFYQAMKFVTTDPEYAERIRLAKTPQEAADLGRDGSKPLRADWDKVKDDVMRHAVWAKFNWWWPAEKALLSTKNAHLIEDAPKDDYWGTGSAKGGGGKNKLGLILEEARALLRIHSPMRDLIRRESDRSGSHGIDDTPLPGDYYVSALMASHGVRRWPAKK